MYDLRSIAENIASIRARRSELAAIVHLDRALAEELSGLEAQDSLFVEACVRHHRINLCQTGFVYGDVLRHPADPAVGVAVRLGDRVETVEGMETPPGEMTIGAATAFLAARVGRALAFRDWHAGGRSLGQREDDLLVHGPRGAALCGALRSFGASVDKVPHAAGAVSAAVDPADDRTAVAPGRTAPASGTGRGRKPQRTTGDERMPDLFG